MLHDLHPIRKWLSAGLLGMALLPGACNKKPVASAPPPAPLPAPVPGPKPEPAPSPLPTTIPNLPSGPSTFDLGEKYFEAGDYTKASQAYESFLRNNVSAANQDRALFRLALTRALPNSPVRDLPQAMAQLRQLIARFPKSPLKAQADFLLGLQGEIERLHVDVSKRDERIAELSRELEKLKQIDIQRRPPSSP